MSTPREGPSPLHGLGPLLGSSVEALDLAWLTGTPEDRAELELAAELARQGINNGLPLLDPPSGNQADGQLRLGRVVHGRSELGWLGVHPDQLTHHLLCIGRSGSGKSTLLVRLLLQLSGSGYPFIAFDHKRSLRALLEMNHLLPIHVVAQGRDLRAALCFNPLCPPPGVPLDTHLRQLVDLIAHSWITGDGVRAVLLRAMTACTEHSAQATFIDVRAYLQGLSLNNRESQWRIGALRVLDQLTAGPLGRVFNTRTDDAALSALLTSRTVIELDGMGVQDGAFFMNVLLRYLVCALQQSSDRERLRLVVAIDEAHHLLTRREKSVESEAERVLREGREVGLGCLLCTQSFANLSPVAVANTGTLVVMSCRHRADIHAAAQGLLLHDHQRDLLPLLPVGEAVVRLASGWLAPVHVRVLPMPMPKGKVRDWDITLAFLEGPYALGRLAVVSADSGDSGPNTPQRPTPPAISPFPRRDTPASPRGITFNPPSTAHQLSSVTALDLLDAEPQAAVLLKHVAAYPLLGVAARYAACGLSRRKGDAHKNALIEHQYVEAVRVTVPEGIVLLLGLTDVALSWLHRHKTAVASVHGSLEHAYWQQRVCDMLTRQGWDAQAEATIDGHAFDVVATKDDERLIVEVETGKSRWLANLAALTGQRAEHKAVLWLDPTSIRRARQAAAPGIAVLGSNQLADWVKRRV